MRADRDGYLVEQNRRLRSENEYLRAHREQLERLLGVALEVATAGTGVEPLSLLEAIEAVDRRIQESPVEKAIGVSGGAS